MPKKKEVTLADVKKELALARKTLERLDKGQIPILKEHPVRFVISHLLTGLFRGLGATFGVTIVFGILGFILGQLGAFDPIGDAFQAIRNLEHLG